MRIYTIRESRTAYLVAATDYSHARRVLRDGDNENGILLGQQRDSPELPDELYERWRKQRTENAHG